jgi:hypothetical protein
MTRHAMLLAIVTLVGCTSDDDEPDGTKIEVAISSPTPFDRLLVATSAQAIASQSEPVLTPELLAGGDAPTAFALWSGSFVTLDFAPAAEANDYYIYTPGNVYAAVIGEVETGSEQTPAVAGDVALPSDDAGSAAISLQPIHVEIWAGVCARLVLPTETHYIVANGDRDCDGLPDETDCKPDAYCDPSATGSAAMAACNCDG